MRGLKLGSKPAEWSTSTTTTKNVVTNFQTTTSWNTTKSTTYLLATTRSTTKSTTTSWTTSRSTTTSWTTSQSTTTSWTTSRSTTRSTTTTWSTSRSTTTSWTTSRSTTTTFNTSQSTTTTFTTTWSTSRATTTTWSTSKSTTTSWTTSRSTTTSWTTTWSTSKSTTTTWSTSKSTTTTWSTSSSTTTSWTTSKSTTTSWSSSFNTSTYWSTSRSTWKKGVYTDRYTGVYFNTLRSTYRFTYSGGGGGGGCIVDKQLVHVSTYKTTEISQFGSGSSILEMDTPFNVDDAESYDEMFNLTSSLIDTGEGLQTGSVTEHRIYSASGGIVNINQYDLMITIDHPQPIFRSGSWTVKTGEDIQIGDGLLNISGSSPTGSIVWVWDLDIDYTGSYLVHDLNTEPHDVFFVNGFLTHNTDFKVKVEHQQ